VFLSNRDEIIQLHGRIFQLYQTSRNQKSSEIYKKFSKLSEVSLKILKLLYVGAAVPLLACPMIMTLFTDNWILPLGFTLPWVQVDSLPGFVINYCHQTLQTFLLVFIYLSYDGLQVVFTIHIYCVYDDLCLMLDELDEDLQDKKKKISPEIRKKIVRIIEAHQELLRFVIKHKAIIETD
jgi:hypothetical protein